MAFFTFVRDVKTATADPVPRNISPLIKIWSGCSIDSVTPSLRCHLSSFRLVLGMWLVCSEKQEKKADGEDDAEN
ncbi:hypothetical protein TNCV_2185211 [Trichonephila clavipes]|nr:hypothetical protein TNCV_2185211 [Trichonephila clavipes]